MKIRFKVHHRPKGDAADIPTYKAGDVYTFDGPVSEGYAKKYIRLGLALEAVDEPIKSVPIREVIEEDSTPAYEGPTVSIDIDGTPPVVEFQRRPGKYRK